jgi:hypothetical protein
MVNSPTDLVLRSVLFVAQLVIHRLKAFYRANHFIQCHLFLLSQMMMAVSHAPMIIPMMFNAT